jgi:hypothetical protein
VVVVDQNVIPPEVVQRVESVKQHPHGGPPGQLKKIVGVQTGAEIVHGQKPGKVEKAEQRREEKAGKGKGKGKE